MCGLLNFKDQIIHFIHSFIHQQWEVFGVCLCVYMTCMYMFITCVHVHVCEYECLWTTDQRTTFSIGYRLPPVSRQGLFSVALVCCRPCRTSWPVNFWGFSCLRLPSLPRSTRSRTVQCHAPPSMDLGLHTHVAMLLCRHCTRWAISPPQEGKFWNCILI